MASIAIANSCLHRNGTLVSYQHNVMRLTRNLLLPAVAALVGVCGGGSGDPTTFEGLIAAANDARLSSLRFAMADTSCSVNSECTVLQFAAICGNDSAPLSLRSATAEIGRASCR